MSDNDFSDESGKNKKKEKPAKEIAVKIKGVVKPQVNPKKLKEYFGRARGYKVSSGALGRCLEVMRDYCRRLAESSFERDRAQIAAPVVFFAPSAASIDISPLRAKVGKDGKIRYSNYCITAFYFFHNTLLRYSCDYSLVYNIVENETAEEVFYSDIISMGIFTDIAEIGEKGECKKYKVKIFRLGTASHHIETVLRNLTVENECSFFADGTDIDKKINRIKNIIGSRKYVNYFVKDIMTDYNGEDGFTNQTDF